MAKRPIPPFMRKYLGTGILAAEEATVVAAAAAQTSAAPDALTSAAITGTLTGTTDGALADVAAINLSTSDTYTDAAVNTAVNTAITAINLQLKELQTAHNEVRADVLSMHTQLSAAIVDYADYLAQLNACIAALKTADLMATA